MRSLLVQQGLLGRTRRKGENGKRQGQFRRNCPERCREEKQSNEASLGVAAHVEDEFAETPVVTDSQCGTE